MRRMAGLWQPFTFRVRAPPARASFALSSGRSLSPTRPWSILAQHMGCPWPITIWLRDEIRPRIDLGLNIDLVLETDLGLALEL
jgi:hypothetical protein